MIKLLGSFDRVAALPHSKAAREYAFVGRSNVGKSSLINALVGSAAARVSNTPGRTRLFNLFEWDGVWLMDLPGYGYARVSRSDRTAWLERLEEYLTARRELKLLFILVDSRRGIKDMDDIVTGFCEENEIPFKIVFTKRDKRDAKCAAADRGIITSAKEKIGIDELKRIILGVA